ncbi:MAG: transposase [Acidobacteriota bacterium]
MDHRTVARDKKKATECRGILLFEDEVSFWQDGSAHRTWAPIGQRPVVDTYGNRNTAHVFGAIEIAEEPQFHYAFADVFSGVTFHAFLVGLLAAYDAQVAPAPAPKLFLIIDNGSCHNLSAEGKVWLAANTHRIELNRLPPYSPEYNGIEACWKTTRRMTTHNAFFATRDDRDAALRRTFERFRADPQLVAAHVRRFR